MFSDFIFKDRDSNTRYFHGRASHRYRKNRIAGLKNNNDVWCTSDEQIFDIVSFYKNFFTSAHLLASQIVLNAIRPSVTDGKNADLIKVFY